MEIKLKEMRQQTPCTKNGIAVTARISNDGLHLGKWEGGGGEKKLNGIPRLNFFEE